MVQNVNVLNAYKRPFVERLVARGKPYYYFRLHRKDEGENGLRRIRLKGEPGSPEFEAHYAELVDTHITKKPPRIDRRRQPRELPHRRDLLRVFMFMPETGELRWHNDGSLAEVPTGNGRYKMVRFMGQRWLAHRVVWKMHTGQEPHDIDHINGDGTDNRFGNLRSVTAELNGRNKSLPPPKHGKHGVRPYGDRWQATAGGRYLGLFSTFEAAVAAREAAEKALGFHENHGRPRALASHGGQHDR